MEFALQILWFPCFTISTSLAYDNDAAFEGIVTLLKTTPIAPAKLCISNLAKFVGPNMTSPQEALGDYLGRGYDPLTDETKFSIFDDSYTNCNVSVDNKYVIPDFYKTELLKEGNRDKMTQVFSSYDEYKSSSDSNIGMGGQGSKSGINLGGSFSKTSQETKTNMEKKETSLILMKLWYKKYRLDADISASFSPAFEGRIEAVIAAFKNGLKRMPRYLVEEIYRDYGTHVVNSAILGVQLERRVFISSSVMSASKEKANSFKLGVAGSMQKQNTADGSFGHGNSETSKARDELSQVERKDFITILGGPNYKNLASDKMEDLITDVNLAALSRETIPIYKMINFVTLAKHNLERTDVEAIQNLFRNIYYELLERNTHPGCTDREYYNFDFQANVDDGTCLMKRCGFYPAELKCNLDRDAICREQELQQQRNYEVKDMSKADYVSVGNGVAESEKKLVIPGYQPKICKEGSKLEEVNKNFFQSATVSEFQDCFKNRYVVSDGDTLKEKKCDKEINQSWNMPPTFTGFYQTCTPKNLTTDFDTELAMIKQWRPPPCEKFDLRIDNLVTRKTKCPFGTNATLIKQYDHQLPDYAIDFECGGHKITVILKDVVTIETYWCTPADMKEPNGLFYGGFYQPGRPNMYLGAEGCSFEMIEIKIFHDTVLCVHNEKQNMDLKNVPELRSIIGRNGERVSCGLKESKIFLTVIDGEKMYACVYKKNGYFKAPSISPIMLPFNDYLSMYERHSQNIMIVDNNITVLTKARDLSNIYGDVCHAENLPDTLTSTKKLEVKSVKTIFNSNLLPILIVSVFVLVGFLIVMAVL